MEINLKSIKIGFLGSITGTFMSISSIFPPVAYTSLIASSSSFALTSAINLCFLSSSVSGGILSPYYISCSISPKQSKIDAIFSFNTGS
jgi:hypothetical protein